MRERERERERELLLLLYEDTDLKDLQCGIHNPHVFCCHFEVMQTYKCGYLPGERDNGRGRVLDILPSTARWLWSVRNL